MMGGAQMGGAPMGGAPMSQGMMQPPMGQGMMQHPMMMQAPTGQGMMQPPMQQAGAFANPAGACVNPENVRKTPVAPPPFHGERPVAQHCAAGVLHVDMFDRVLRVDGMRVLCSRFPR